MTSELIKLESVRTDILNDEREPFPLSESESSHLHLSLNMGYYVEGTSEESCERKHVE